MQFKIIEVRQKVKEREENKAQAVMSKASNVMQDLANIGRMFGVKTEFLTSMSNLGTSLVNLGTNTLGSFVEWAKGKKLTEEEKKVANIITSNDTSMNLLKEYIYGKFGLTLPPEPINSEEDPAQIQANAKLLDDIIGTLIDWNGWSKGDSKKAAEAAIARHPETKTAAELAIFANSGK